MSGVFCKSTTTPLEGGSVEVAARSLRKGEAMSYSLPSGDLTEGRAQLCSGLAVQILGRD